MANAIPLKVNNAEGCVEQFGSTDVLLADGVERRSSTGNLIIGSVLGTVEATGSITVAGVPAAAGGTITINGTVLTAVDGARTPGSNDFSLDSGTVNGIASEIVAAINDVANGFTSIVTAVDGTGVVNLTAVPLGTAGNSITLATSDAVSFTLSGVNLTGGVTDSLQLGSATSIVAIQGDLTVAGSSTISVDETVIGDFAVEGNVSLGTGDGDTIDLGGGTSDTVNLNADLTVGAGVVSIGSSVTDYLGDLWLDAVNTNGPGLAAYNLNATGTNAGAYAIGVDPSLLLNASATDLMTVLDQLDAAISASGADTLQTAYAAGNTIAVTAAEGTIDFSNSTASDTTTVLTVSRAPSSSTGGNGIDLSMGANTTGVGLSILAAGSGDALFVDNTGSGNALDVQDGSSSVLQVTGAGAVNVTPTSGQSLTMTVAGAGVVDINAAGAITLDSTGAGISLDGAGASNFTTSTGDLTVNTASGSLVMSATTAVTLDATVGGVSIDAAAASNFSTSAGNLTLDAAAAELVFDDVGNSGLTLSQSSDRTLSPTGAGLLYDGVTSIIGAFNALGVRDKFTKTLPIEVGVTISAGYVVAASTTSGRLTNGTGGSGGNKAIVGIALSGGTGDAGGTVTATFVLPGAYVTVAGGSFTPGTPVFAPLLAGPPSDTFSGGTGDRNIRLGYAITSTDIVFMPTVGVGI